MLNIFFSFGCHITINSHTPRHFLLSLTILHVAALHASDVFWSCSWQRMFFGGIMKSFVILRVGCCKIERCEWPHRMEKFVNTHLNLMLVVSMIILIILDVWEKKSINDSTFYCIWRKMGAWFRKIVVRWSLKNSRVLKLCQKIVPKRTNFVAYFLPKLL